MIGDIVHTVIQILLAGWAGYLIGQLRSVREREVTLHVTPELTERIQEKIIIAWLDRRGLTWMPKGVDYSVPHDREAK